MEIKTKYNVNDKIVVKDNDNKIPTTIKRIEIYCTDANLGIKYITNYGAVYEDNIIDKNDFLNELNNTNNKTENPTEVITMNFTPVDKGVKFKNKYNIGQIVEYDYKGKRFISIIEKIIYNDENITYKVVHDGRNFSEKEIKPIELNVDDEIVYFIPYKTNKILYLCGIITSISFDHIIIKNNDDYKVNIKYNQIVRRI